MADHEDHPTYLNFSYTPQRPPNRTISTSDDSYSSPSLLNLQSHVARSSAPSYVDSPSSSRSVSLLGEIECGFIPDEIDETTHLLSDASSRPSYHARSPSLSSIASTTFAPDNSAQLPKATPLPMKQLTLLMIGQLPEPGELPQVATS